MSAEGEDFECLTCHVKFPSFEALHDHSVRYQGRCVPPQVNSAKFSERFECPYCHDKFSCRYALANHREICPVMPDVSIDASEIDVPIYSFRKTREGSVNWYKEKLDEYFEQERLKHAAITCQKEIDAMTNPRQKERYIQWCLRRKIPIKH